MNQDGYTCRVCQMDIWLPIANLGCSSLGLVDDARYPGRCILMLTEHAEQIGDLEPALASRFFEDARWCCRAIQRVTGAERVNLAVLGNKDPHLHFHLIPRPGADDPIRQRSPWEHPDAQNQMAEGRCEELISAIRATLPLCR